MRAERRNITVTNKVVSDELNKSENASKFIEKCILYYLEEQQKDYVTQDDFQILNRNYLEMRDILNELVQTFLPK